MMGLFPFLSQDQRLLRMGRLMASFLIRILSFMGSKERQCCLSWYFGRRPNQASKNLGDYIPYPTLLAFEEIIPDQNRTRGRIQEPSSTHESSEVFEICFQ